MIHLLKLEPDMRLMTDDTFEKHKIGSINKRLEKLNDMTQEMSCFLTHITSDVFDFVQIRCYFPDYSNICDLRSYV